MSTATATLESAESTAMITRDFILAGRAIFTVEIPESFRERTSTECQPHYTFKITRKKADSKSTDKTTPYFAFLLSGPNNEYDYVYMGCVRPDADTPFVLTAKSKMNSDSWPVRILSRVLARILAGDAEMITDAGWNVHHVGCCGRCGRTLTTPESVKLGIGPECYRAMQGE